MRPSLQVYHHKLFKPCHNKHITIHKYKHIASRNNKHIMYYSDCGACLSAPFQRTSISICRADCNLPKTTANPAPPRAMFQAR